MAVCTFCEKKIEPGTGTMYVKKDAKIYYFCSKKCQRNMLKLKRKARVINWTGKARAEKVKNNAK